MKVILTEAQIITLKRNSLELDEMGMKSRKGDNPEKKFNFVANALIDYMDKNGITTIPTYTALSYDNRNIVDITKYEPDAQKPFLTWKYILNSFLGPKEFDIIVKPLIAKLRPEFSDYSTGSKIGAKNQVIDGLRMASIGEIITYNTFKMNGIILEHEPSDQVFIYTYIGLDGLPKTAKKIPDFYWREKNMMIEVAGFRDDGVIAKNYSTKINAAKEEMLKQGREYVILDYFKDRNNTQKFFKTVCDTFNFKYDMADYPKAITGYKGVDRNYCEKEVKRILSMTTKESTGAERARVAVMMNNCLSRTIETPEGTEEVGYTSKYEVRDDMGLLRRSNPEVRNRVQVAWCKSPFVGPKKVAIAYNEMYDDRINHNTVEIIMNRNRDMFDKNNKETICSKIGEVESGEEELEERGRTLANTRKKRLFPKSAMMANPLRFKEYDKEVKDLDEIQTRGKKLLGKGREREVYLSHINPDLVFKLWGYDDLVKEKEFFDKYPNIYVTIHKVKTYENPHYSNTGVAIMDRVDTKGFKQEVRKLYDASESVGYSNGIFNLIDMSRREKKYDEIVNKLNEYDPSIADFFINFRDCVVGVEDSLGVFNFFDRSFDQFGLDKEGNVKCFDV